MYNVNNHSLLYYSDSVSHLVRARQLIDYSSPGLEQIGTVWLPLPHLMLLPFSLVDLLFKTGLAGTFISLPSIAIAAAIIYRIIKVQTNVSWIAFLGACLYFLNPNILYLGITAMTEALFMLFFVVAAFYFQKCVSLEPFSARQIHNIIEMKNHIVCFDGLRQTLGSKHKSIISNNLFKCSFFITLATLCRYEAWPIPVVLALFIILSLLRFRTIDKGKEAWDSNKKRLICGLICIVLSLSGVILWISYNWIYYGSPLEFLFSPYYSAAAQALEGGNRDFLFLQPLNAASTYGVNALVFFGPIIIGGAIFGYIVHRKYVQGDVRRREMVFLFLAIPSFFNFLALVFGIGEMNYWWFNSRFMIMLSPLLILLLSILIKKVTDEPVKNKSILVYAIVAIFLIYPIIILPTSGEITTLIDAKNSVSYGTRPSAMDIAAVLGSFYENGKIFMITGSAQQNIIMQASGIPLTNFYAAIDPFNSSHQLQQFERDSHYVILSKNPDPSSQSYAKSWTERQGELTKYFDKAYENSFYILFVRNSF
jgi:hypothetical protein